MNDVVVDSVEFICNAEELASQSVSSSAGKLQAMAMVQVMLGLPVHGYRRPRFGGYAALMKVKQA